MNPRQPAFAETSQSAVVMGVPVVCSELISCSNVHFGVGMAKGAEVSACAALNIKGDPNRRVIARVDLATYQSVYPAGDKTFGKLW